MLLYYQAKWQQHLLAKYEEAAHLDETYKTTRYAVSLFFLCAWTNVNYAVVGTFVIQRDTIEATGSLSIR